MTKHIIVMGNSQSGKDEFIKIFVAATANINKWTRTVSIIDFAKKIQSEYCNHHFDPKSSLSRKMQADIKDVFDDFGDFENGSCGILLQRIKEHKTCDYILITIREPKDAEYVRSQLSNCVIVFVDRNIDHGLTLRSENTNREILLNICDYVINNNGDIKQLRAGTNYFLNALLEETTKGGSLYGQKKAYCTNCSRKPNYGAEDTIQEIS